MEVADDILQADNDMSLKPTVCTDTDVIKQELDSENEYEGLEERPSFSDPGNSDKIKQDFKSSHEQTDFEGQFAHTESIVKQEFAQLSNEENDTEEQFAHLDSSLVKQEYKQDNSGEPPGDPDHRFGYKVNTFGESSIKREVQDQSYDESCEHGQHIPLVLEVKEANEDDENNGHLADTDYVVKSEPVDYDEDQMVENTMVITGPEAGDLKPEPYLEEDADDSPLIGRFLRPDYKAPSFTDEESDSSSADVSWRPSKRQWKSKSTHGKRNTSKCVPSNSVKKPRNTDNVDSTPSREEEEKLECRSTFSGQAVETLVKKGAGRGRYSQIVEDVPVVKVHRVNPMGIPLLNPLAMQGANGKVTYPGQFITLQNGQFGGAQLVQLVNAQGIQLSTQPGIRVGTSQGIQVSPQPVIVSAQPSIQIGKQPGFQVDTQPGIQSGTQPGIQVRAQPGIQAALQPRIQVGTPFGIPVKTQSCEGVETRSIQIGAQPSIQVGSRPSIQARTQLSIPIATQSQSIQGVKAKCVSSTALPKRLPKTLPTLMPKGVPSEHTAIYTYTKKKRFACNLCGKEFDMKANRKRHELLHTGEKPFKCDICDKAFIQSQQLEIHKRTHSGDKPFKCEHCDMAYREARYLKKHVVLHTGEKSFKCKFCSEDFVSSYRLSLHMKTHKGEMLFMRYPQN